MTIQSATCNCCGLDAKFNIELMVTEQGESALSQIPRYYLPNQHARQIETTGSKLDRVWFCHECMRAIEDAVRATILYLQSENGKLAITPQTRVV